MKFLTWRGRKITAPKYLPAPVWDYCTNLLLTSEIPQDDQDRILRLIERPEMKGVYKLLADTFADEGEDSAGNRTVDFIDAAWLARMDFTRYRKELKQASEINLEIGKKASELAWLLRDFAALNIGLPPREFLHVSRLIDRTTNRGEPMWEIVKHEVTGITAPTDKQVKIYLPDNKRGPSQVGQSDGSPVHIYDPENPPPADTQQLDPDPLWSLRYAWGKAPILADLLDTLAKVSRENDPQAPSETIEKAIASRKRTYKTAYLRAFGHLLTEEHRIDLSTSIMNAMAGTANVALHDPDTTDVTYDDVRKACERLG